MKIREAKYKECPTCSHRTMESGEAYGCDNCKKPIDYGLTENGHHQYLSANVFSHDSSPSKDMHFCSWKCALQSLKKVKSNYFVSLPYLLYDEKQKGVRAKDFFEAIKAFK